MKDFDKYISSSFSTDYWADEGIGISEEKISHFSTEDWNELNHTIKNRDAVWLIRCAEVLGDHEDTKSLEVLMNLSTNNNIEVKIAALDSMNSLLSIMSIDSDAKSNLYNIVNEIDQSSIVVKTMLDSLKKKLV